ncbi:hypothetical protein [Streptomyces longwoodensis]|uniref:hypothetical protein n=1 Tax=Streptomyces longwoodensis TaxID=68231 RepID=UPI00131E836A|nr:hypothetical protein [Streptomyces longwoodensis]
MGDEDPPGDGVAGVAVGGRPQDRFGVAQHRERRSVLRAIRESLSGDDGVSGGELGPLS